jgi:hypothetical protein
MLWTILSIFMLRMPIFHHELGSKKMSPLFVAFVSATLNLDLKTYRGFEHKADRVLGYNIIVVPNRRYGLKRRSGIFGSILDLNVGSVQ